MNILILSQYFWPEPFIINDLVKILRDNGHHITIATGKPNYPNGCIYDGYTAENTGYEIFDNNIEVYRVPVKVRGNGSPVKLIRNYLSFVVSGLRWFPSLLKDHSFDAILVFSPSPITMAIPAIFLKLRRNIHLAIWVQDLWPQSLSATGFIKNRFVLYMTGLLVKGIYFFADTLLVQSRAFIEPVNSYARRDKIIYYPNSYLYDSSVTDDSALPDHLLTTLEQHFCLVFAGNLGIAQSLETIVDACVRIKHLSDCRVILVGSGSKLAWLQEKKVELDLDNLIIAGRFSVSIMPAIFERAAGLLVTLKREPIFSYTIPSKIQAYMAAGRPILAALDGEGAKVIEEAGAGLTCPAEDAGRLSANIERLYHMADIRRAEMGKAGRRYFYRNFEMRHQAQELVNILHNRVPSGGKKHK